MIPLPDARFPATATLHADNQRLYFDLPGEAGSSGPTKRISFRDASARPVVYIGNAPDRDSSDGFFTLNITFTDSDGRTSRTALPIHEIDQDQPPAPHYRITADYSQDATGFFRDSANRAPVDQALADWSYFFDDMKLDTVPAGQESTFIWVPMDLSQVRTS